MLQFWNDRKLAQDFAENGVTDKEKLVYFLIFQVAVVLVPDLLATEPTESTPLRWISLSLSAAITALGYYWCYRSNKDNKEYIARCICLGLPVALKVLVWFMLPIFSFFLFGYFIFSETAMDRISDADLLWEASGNLVLLVYFWKLNADIQLIQKLSPGGQR